MSSQDMGKIDGRMWCMWLHTLSLASQLEGVEGTRKRGSVLQSVLRKTDNAPRRSGPVSRRRLQRSRRRTRHSVSMGSGESANRRGPGPPCRR